MMNRCFLCDEVDGGSRALSALLLGRLAEPLEESDHFLALPDIQPLVDGHSLLLTKFHIRSFSELPVAHSSEFRSICDRLKLKLESRYGRPFVFEHGPGGGPSSGSCVDHAHLHFFPLEAPVPSWLTDIIDGRVTHGAGEILATLSLSSVTTSYLYYQDQRGCDIVVDNLETPAPCQFIRRAVASHVGTPNWNWKTAFFESSVGQS
jgi:diadenosine tetraphosphate (Ap4A) HIT family hydrolase